MKSPETKLPLRKLVNSHRKDPETGKPIFLEAPALSRDSLLAFISRHEDGVDFVALQTHFLDRGNYFLKNSKNQVYWKGISKELSEELLSLFEEDEVRYITCAPRVYWSQMRGVPLPLAKRPNWKYTRDHWQPVKVIAVKGEDIGKDNRDDHP